MANPISRTTFPKSKESDILLTDDFLHYLQEMHDRFSDRIREIRRVRQKTLEEVHRNGVDSLNQPEVITSTSQWSVDPVPEDLKRPGIEISGPSSLAHMFINAVNPGPEGERAVGYLDDDEDSGGHTLQDTLNSAQNRLQAVEGTLRYEDPSRGRIYEVEPGELPFLMHRERGLHLDEPSVTIDGTPVSATILSTCLTIFHAGRAQIAKNKGVYFYLPKLESSEEVAIYKDFFDLSKKYLNLPKSAVIKGIILVESLPAVYRMEEMLRTLGTYGAGLNAARWDLKASILEYIMTDPKSVWPDRFDVDIKTTAFISNIFRRLVAICLKHGAVAIGGMATALPSRDEDINRLASASIRNDKEWEARQGFLRGWTAHIYHMKTASDPFVERWNTGWAPPKSMKDPSNYPVVIEVPNGQITKEGTRRNVRTVVEYVEGWLSGRGAKGIDSMEGREGKHPALMEDLATARISVGQVSQRIIHQALASDTGETHSLAMIKSIIDSEIQDILRIRSLDLNRSDFDLSKTTYESSRKITLRWIKNYTQLNFKSLGSYTREDLSNIASSPDAF